MTKTLVQQITNKRLKLGGGKTLLSLKKCAKQIGISSASLWSVIKYGEAAAGNNILPKLEAWLKKESEKS